MLRIDFCTWLNDDIQRNCNQTTSSGTHFLIRFPHSGPEVVYYMNIN